MIDVMLILHAIGAYCIGSIPSGFLIARFHGISDIREHGSGNIGATNVARMLGLHYFFIVFLCDFSKAYAYLMMVQWLGCSLLCSAVVAAALLLGNAFSLFLGFRGGKGVATSFGILCALQPYVVLYAAVCWLAVFAVSRIAGMASVVTLIMLPMISVFMVHDVSWMGLLVFFISMLGLFLHRTNIKSF